MQKNSGNLQRQAFTRDRVIVIIRSVECYDIVKIKPTETVSEYPLIVDSLVGRALHWYHRGHGFQSLLGLNFFFQALIS